MSPTRKEAILFHAAKLFSERGVARTTVRDIADEVGILSGSLYHHFASKHAIVFEIVITFIDDLNDRYEATLVPGETARGRLDRMIAVSFESATDHPYATEIYQNESTLSSQPADSHIATAVRRANQYWADAIARGIETGEFRTDADPHHFHRMLRESVWFTVRFHRDSLAASADRLRHDLIAVFLDGFATGDAARKPAASTLGVPSGPPAVPAPEDTAGEPALIDLQRNIRELEEAVRELRLQRG